MVERKDRVLIVEDRTIAEATTALAGWAATCGRGDGGRSLAKSASYQPDTLNPDVELPG